MAATTAMIDPWQAAYSRFIEDLNDEEQTLFQNATLDNLLTSTDTAQKTHEDESRSRHIFQRLEPFINAIDQYSHALDIYTNAYPSVMAPLWGSIRVLLHVNASLS